MEELKEKDIIRLLEARILDFYMNMGDNYSLNQKKDYKDYFKIKAHRQGKV